VAFEIDITDALRGLIRLADFPDLARGPIREAVQQTAELVEATARPMISRQGPPRSRPGEPPAVDQGALVRSLRTRLMPSKKSGERAYVLAPEYYGFMLESGTRRMRPRPFMVSAAQSQAEAFVAKVEAAIEQAAGQSNR
jgi:hypothetical protein